MIDEGVLLFNCIPNSFKECNFLTYGLLAEQKTYKECALICLREFSY